MTTTMMSLAFFILNPLKKMAAAKNSVSVSLPPTVVELVSTHQTLEEEQVQSELVVVDEEEEEENDSVEEEITVMDASVVQVLDDAPPPHDADDDDNLVNKSSADADSESSTWLTDRRYAWIFTVSVIVAFCLGLVGSVIASHVMRRRRAAAASSLAFPPSNVPTPAPSAPLDHRGPVFEEFLRSTLNLPQQQQQFDNNDLFVDEENEHSALQRQQQQQQEAALQWLVREDREFLRDSPLPTRDRVFQRYALVVLNYATGRWRNSFGGWANPDGAHLHECMWPGVFCHENDNGNDDNMLVVRAIEIDSVLGILNGTLPTEIGHFSRLERLLLSDNFLAGTIPSEIFTLSNLYALRLSYTDITVSQLSGDIGNLTNLAYLDLSFNSNLEGSIPTELGLCTKLRAIHLQETNVNGRIPPELGSLTFLDSLHLEGTSITGSVPDDICNLTVRFLDDLVVDCPAIRCDCCSPCE